MLRKIRERMESEKGFTLIELLVVILIIGILAAIALPAFLGQRKKGQDGSAKSDVRNIVSHMESCFTQSQTYAGCETSDDITGSGIQGVTISGNNATTYQLEKTSSSGNVFTYNKGAANPRTCTTADTGGCNNLGRW
jgi:type IV pilus assembly protein PilA